MPRFLRTFLLLDTVTPTLRGVFLLAMSVSLIFFVGVTLHWPMMVDSPVMHYVIFLTEHGLRPYRDITDNNMPGAYLIERFAMEVFGGGDLGWRLYDFFLLLLLTASFVVISGPRKWLAGVFAGGLFALRHGSEGAWFAGEREQEMTVLLAAACALLFLAVRRKQPLLVLGFGFLAAMASGVKPTLTPFMLLALVSLGMALKRRQIGSVHYLIAGTSGIFVVAALNFGFLYHYGALHAFFFVLRTVTPVYIGLGHPNARFMLLHTFPFELLPLAGLASVSYLTRQHRWPGWETWVLLFAAGNGLLSYFIQQKGFYHHRYVFVAFLLLVISLELLPSRAEEQLQGHRAVLAASLLYSVLYLMPTYALALLQLPRHSSLTEAMEKDLSRLGGERLQEDVQCFDLTFGCLNSLYHLQLVENTGFTGDLLLFPTRPNAATDYYRDLFWRLQAKAPAGVLVITNQEFGAPNTYNRLSRWPQFSGYLAQKYDLAVTRSFPYEDKFAGQLPAPPESAPGYRIYVRKGKSFSSD